MRVGYPLPLCDRTPVISVGGRILLALLLNWESDLVKMDILCYFMRSKHPVERVSKAAYHGLSE